MKRLWLLFLVLPLFGADYQWKPTKHGHELFRDGRSLGEQQGKYFYPNEGKPFYSPGTLYYSNGSWAVEATDEVNATRAQRGLRPFLRDGCLVTGALACARIRADHLIEGHIDDFAHLPAGCSAAAGGCAAWTPDWGWGACCTYENYTYVGAAYAYGRDGRRYMHLFVR